jgi:hypothetical protein
VSERPWWRQIYDGLDGAVAPPLERLVRTSEFADAAAWATRAQAMLLDQVNGAAARVWHLMNLPAGTDVQRLRVQIGALDREVRLLTLQLAQQAEKEAVKGAGLPADEQAANPADKQAEDPADMQVEKPAGKVTDDADTAQSDGRARSRAPRGGAKRGSGA